jgi:mRNA-degrading endonuclease RelE of RelBE toxin-antitoxin system
VHPRGRPETPYALEWSEEARADLAAIPVFHRGRVVVAIQRLRFQAELETRHRRPLREPVEELPEATWEVRAGDYRALYWLEGRTAWILRVILKGRRTMQVAVMRSRKP